MAATQEFTGTLVAISCGQCGVTFGIPESMYNARRNDHETFYCPNGDARAYTGRSEAERLREDLKWTRMREQSWRDQAETAENRRRAQKAVTTKLKKRIAAGVCPCCHRNFQDLRRHVVKLLHDTATALRLAHDTQPRNDGSHPDAWGSAADPLTRRQPYPNE